jgi:hypothetical protein
MAAIWRVEGICRKLRASRSGIRSEHTVPFSTAPNVASVVLTFTAQGREGSIPKGKPQCEPSKLLLDASHCGLPSVHAKARRGDPEHGHGYTRPHSKKFGRKCTEMDMQSYIYHWGRVAC